MVPGDGDDHELTQRDEAPARVRAYCAAVFGPIPDSVEPLAPERFVGAEVDDVAAHEEEVRRRVAHPLVDQLPGGDRITRASP